MIIKLDLKTLIKTEINKNFEITIFADHNKPVITPDMIEMIKELYPEGFNGYIDSGMGAVMFFKDIGCNTEQVDMYLGGRSNNEITTRKENAKGKKEIDVKWGSAIISAWKDIVDFIKVCVKNNPGVKAVRSNKLQRRVSKYLFGSQKFLNTILAKKISFQTTSFSESGSQFISKEKIHQIFCALLKKYADFGFSNWEKLYEKFVSFWNIRFKLDPNSKNYGERFDDYTKTYDTMKQAIYDGIREIFADNLRLNEFLLLDAFLIRLLEPYASHQVLTSLGAGKKFIEHSTIFRIISEVRDLSKESIIKSAKQKSTGVLSKLNCRNNRFRDLAKLRSETEEYLLDFYMSDLSGVDIPARTKDKIFFDLETFYIIYKNTPIDERGKLSLTSIRYDLDSFTKKNNLKSQVSQFGIYSKLSATYSWDSVVALTAFIRQKMVSAEISRPDYLNFLHTRKRFCIENGISAKKPNGYNLSKGHKIYINDTNINPLSIDDKDIAGNRFLHHFYKLNTLKKGEVLPEFKHEVKVSDAAIRASDLSKDPYSKNKGFTKQHRLKYIKFFTNSIEYGTSHKDFQQLIEYAQLRDDDIFVLNDANLLKLINSSASYNDQPSHPFIQCLALKYISSMICTEPLIWIVIDDIVYSGHPDFIQIKGDTIRILDYKPDLYFNPNVESHSKHFIESIPQVAAYGIMFDMMFGISSSKYQIECVTFNEDGYYLYDPYEALESSVEFYYKITREMPVWHKFLHQDIIDRIIQKIPRII